MNALLCLIVIAAPVITETPASGHGIYPFRTPVDVEECYQMGVYHIQAQTAAWGINAKPYIQTAANAGHALAQATMGLHFSETPEDAAQWYNLAAEGKSLWAIKKMHQIYIRGEGVPVDHYSAYVWGLIYNALKDQPYGASNVALPTGRLQLSDQQRADGRAAAQAWLASH